ncbi:MAG: UDP-N-acetylmuramate--L-alanine ligase [Armatimonadetes bacterium]|nr:UDP-N-acetylmuramate--L-alanine ligase [Armatimonadota bacterium]
MMSAIARLLTAQGHRVSGSDQAASDYTRALAAEGITVYIGHDAANLADDVDWLAVSAAVPAENPELTAARQRGLPIRSRADVLGAAVNPKSGLCVAGTHGKTTTSGMASVILVEAGLDPTFLVGSLVGNYGTNCRVGAGEWVVVEADEYARAFLALEPRTAIVTNVENDHPDIYVDLADYVATFRQFVSQVRPDGLLLLGADCPTAAALADAAVCRVQTYGFAAGADWRTGEPVPSAVGQRFALTSPEGESVTVELAAVGRHNAQNAAAAVAAAVEAGVPLARAAELIGRFGGTARRFERLVDSGGIVVVDDYAHHPAEVRATVLAATQLGRRLRVVYEPHQFARTRALLAEYAGVFDPADETLLCDIYAAREHDTLGVDSAQVAAVAGGEAAGVSYVGGHDDAFARLTAAAGDRETWLVMGAGDVTALAHRLAEWVRTERA